MASHERIDLWEYDDDLGEFGIADTEEEDETED
jgi:hypothetical protein